MSLKSKLAFVKKKTGDVVYHVKMKRYLKKANPELAVTIDENLEDNRELLYSYQDYENEMQEYTTEPGFLMTKISERLQNNNNIRSVVAEPFLIFEKEQDLTLALLNYNGLIKNLEEFERDLFYLYRKYKIFW